MKKELLENIVNSKRNNIISGIMSTGKTNNIGFKIVKKIIEQEENLFILDTKEEYLKRFYDLFKENNYNITIINTKNPEKSHSWNPLKYSKDLYINGKTDESIKYLSKLSEELFYDNSESDSFWTNSAIDYFMGITLFLYKYAKEEEINLISIYQQIANTEKNINYLEEIFRTMDKDSPAYICAQGTLFSPKETREGIICTALSKLNKIICKDKLNTLLNETSYNYEEILTKKNVIFFVADEMDNISFLPTIYIKELFNIISDNSKSKKFNFILDNFDYLDNLTNLKNTLSLAINKNMKFYLFTRDKETLENKYSKYINKLSNNIILLDDEIIININEKTKKITNKPINNTYISNIDYPINKIKESSIFDLKEFVINNIQVVNREYKKCKLINTNNDEESTTYNVTENDEIISSFSILTKNNLLIIDNKKLIDINYLNFIFDHLKEYNYLTLKILSSLEYIINTLKFNFDIISIEEIKEENNLYKIIKIKI